LPAKAEIPITLTADGAILEGRLYQASLERAVIITHPHPLYGGDMDNNVVVVIAEAFAQQEWSTLRFNFRGVGKSTGQYADGIGEQNDIQAAIDYLILKGFQTIDLAGYSFGAWVLTGWARKNATHLHRLFLVSPPVAFVDFDDHSPIPGLYHIFTGSRDDLAPPRPIQKSLPQWHFRAQLTVIADADHFFWGHAQTLQKEIAVAI